MNKRLGTLLAISILLHLGLLFLITAPAFRRFVQHLQPVPAVPPPPPSLTLLKLEAPPKPQPPPPTQFVPTLPSQEVAQPDPNAILESERDTALRSREAAKNPDSPLPALTGNPKAAFNYQDTPASPQLNSTPAQPATPAPRTPPTPKPVPPAPPAPAPPVPKAEPVTPMNAKPEPNLPPPDFNTIPVTPPPVETKTPGDKDKDREATANSQPADPRPTQPQQSPSPPQQPPQKPQPQQPSPPPSTESFAQSRSNMDGSASQFGDPSPESKATDIGRYKAKLYRMIGSRWYLNVEKSMSMLSVGAVHIKFYVQANGVIDPKSIEVEGGGNSDILETISRDAVKHAYGEPFTDSMRQQLGDGYWEDITFTIY